LEIMTETLTIGYFTSTRDCSEVKRQNWKSYCERSVAMQMCINDRVSIGAWTEPIDRNGNLDQEKPNTQGWKKESQG
jgi:hypothetical protein